MALPAHDDDERRFMRDDNNRLGSETCAVHGEQKWTHPSRINEELKQVAEKMVSNSDRGGTGGTERGRGRGSSSVKPTIMRAPHTFREFRPEEFRYSPVEMCLGLYNRGDLEVPTEVEKRRMEGVVAFMKKLNVRRSQLGLDSLQWDELSRRVVPNPSRVKLLYKDAPAMTDEDVRYLLAIDAVFMLCLFQGIGGRFPQIQSLDKDDIETWKVEGTMQDFLLMENQIPLVLIQNALAVALEGEHRELPMLQTCTLERTTEHSTEEKGNEEAVDIDDDEKLEDVDLVCPEEFHPEINELLGSVLETFLGEGGLQCFLDNYLPGAQIASSDHLLDFVYRVVASKSRVPSEDEDCERDDKSTGTSDALIKQDKREKSPHYFIRLMSYLQSLQVVFPAAVVSAYFSKSEVLREDRWRNSHMIPTASQLKKAGISVKGSKETTIWDYRVVQGLFTDTLFVPKLEIWLGTPNSLRNLLLIEMRQQSLIDRRLQPLMEYLILLDQLVDTREDAIILCGNTDDYVIFNTLGDAGVLANLINDLCQSTWKTEDSPAFVKFCRDVQLCYRKRRKRMFWEFVETHLNKPWKIASLLAALLLLVLTLLQTVYSMLSYY